jgi:hypothetical protein
MEPGSQPTERVPEPGAIEASRTPQVPAAYSPWQLVGALLIAGASDIICGAIDATGAGSVATIPLDIITALALWAVLGRPVILLVALVAEALPGVGVLPLWSAVVIAIAMTGGIPGRAVR